MSFRQDVEFKWDGATVRSRPTLARVSEVEQKFGPAMQVLGRLGRSELSLTREFLPLLWIMLRGADGVPKAEKPFLEQAFEAGAVGFTTPMIEWLSAAYVTNEPPPPEDPAGN